MKEDFINTLDFKYLQLHHAYASLLHELTPPHSEIEIEAYIHELETILTYAKAYEELKAKHSKGGRTTASRQTKAERKAKARAMAQARWNREDRTKTEH